MQPPDTPLSERGRGQAARLAARLAGAGVREIRASDLLRARVTAEAVQAITGARVVLDAGLRERDYGRVRGQAYADLDVDIFAPGYVPPEGESWEVFHARVDRVWARITAEVDQAAPLLVVTHGLVCYSLAAHHLVMPPGTTPGMRWGNTSLTVVRGPDPWRIELLDCTAHLDGTRDPAGGTA